MKNSFLTAVIVLVIIVLVGWFAYTQGFFKGQEAEDNSGVEINLGGNSGEQN